MYIKRNITSMVYELLEDFRIVAINGPRQSGKTTLSKEIAKELGMNYYTFDNEATKITAQNNPIPFIQQLSKNPSVIDEIQMVPEVISALKISVDEKNQSGMFLLTGSADIFKMSSIKESLAGRMVSVSLFPLSYFELNGCNKNAIDMLFDGEIKEFNFKKLSYEEMIEQITTGGFPSVQGKSARSQESWFESYIEARIEKDLSLVKKIKRENKSEINKLLRILASMTSNLLKYSSLSKHLNIKDMTVKSDIEILEALFLVKRVNPYFTNRGKREIKAPKIQFIDTGLVAHLIGVDAGTLILKEREMLGNLVENFIYTELLKHSTYAKKSTNIYHYRDGNYEVDLVLEQKNSKIVAIEIKSSATIKIEYTRGLVALAKNAKDNFLEGYIFYGGSETLPISKDGYIFWCIPFGVLFGEG
ncbi:ATPase [hydrothermal vent metagenome]|uniref:ATPase n=1 Tax=hydrothermal vent metagenome TaxID=652676 RepID=A0A1W1BKK3_9ZZZZ